MIKKEKAKPTASNFTILRQLCNLIPPHLVPKLARETGVDSMARSFSAWSHVVSMLFAQLTHAIGLNDVCDALRLHSGLLSALRGATPPSRNNLSHANKHRDAALAERLFWAVLEHLQKVAPRFATGRRGKGLARRFRRVIHVVDSSTIALIVSCIDWAQHRRRKAAAKLHVRLDLHSLLPRFVLVESAKAADSIRAAEVCAGVKPGEIVIFDRAYVDFVHLAVLEEDGVFWVTRSKESLSFRVVKKLPKPADKRILSDEVVVLKNKDSRANYPKALRRVRALAAPDRHGSCLSPDLALAPLPSAAIALHRRKRRLSGH